MQRPAIEDRTELSKATSQPWNRAHSRFTLAASIVLLAGLCPCKAQNVSSQDEKSEVTSPKKNVPSVAALGTNPEDQRSLFGDQNSIGFWPASHNVHVYGWVDGGITTVGHASGLVTEAPTTNRFSNQVILNAVWVVLERKTTDKLSWGFRSDFYAGADAALLRSLNHFGPGGPRFGTEIREAYAMVHTPIPGGHDIQWTAGRINFPTGAETVFGAYQKLYSRGYFWIHAETSGTAIFATTHATSAVDVVAGTTMGYNTTYILRGRAPDYLASVIVHPRSAHPQQLIATVYSGPRPIAATVPHAGNWQTLAELEARETWTKRFSQVFQTSYITDTRDPANRNHTSVTHGALILSSFALTQKVTLNNRLEWFADTQGVRIAIPGTYSDAALGLSFRPRRWLEFRPEIRGDFAGQRAFGPVNSGARYRNQFSSGFELLFKGKLF